MVNRLRLRHTSALVGGVLAFGLIGTPVLAQTAPTPQDDETAVDEVVVTGSRIRLQDYVAPNPVTTLTSETIESSGQTNIVQFLQDVPALINSIDSETGADANDNFVGYNLLNLRNLGSVRTLVLVDGRRHVGSVPGTTSVDIAQIPTSLIERVEILTGGASAIYGADGVSGVVNFILKDDFEGVDLRTQYGWSEKGGGDNTFVSGLFGRNFDGDRGNVMVGFEYDYTQDLKFEQRSFTEIGRVPSSYNSPLDGTGVCPAGVSPPPASCDDPNRPDFLVRTGLTWADTSLEGSIITGGAAPSSRYGFAWLGNGQPYIAGPSAGSAFMVGGSGTPLEAFNDDLIPGQERYTLFARGTYDLTPNHEIFADIKYTNSTAEFVGQPSYDYGLFLSMDNPYMPASVRADALTPGGTGTPAGAVDYGLPGPGVLMAKDNFFLGRRTEFDENETLRGVVGIRGELGAGISYDVSAVYGKATQTIDYTNVRLADRYYAATDVVQGPNGPVCRSNLNPNAPLPVGDLYGQLPFNDPSLAAFSTFTRGPNSGCLPLNAFGLNADPAAIDWVMGEAQTSAELEQTVINAFITGDSSAWFSLPAGPVSFVLGAEYREESSSTTPDPLQTLAEAANFAGISDMGRAVATIGQYDVKEVFTELSVPVLADLPFAQELTVNGAYRYSDYSTGYSTDTWNVGLRYRPIQDVLIRGTKAFAVRAPNINNLFEGRSTTAGSFSDPCDLNFIGFGENPTNRRANCQAAFTALGVNLATYENTSTETTLGFRTGNPNLKPEEADTVTGGIVFTPSFVPGLALSLDYYDIEIDGAIATYGLQQIINNCYDLPAGNEFCGFITRGVPAVNPGRIVTFDVVPGNLQTFRTSGAEFGARYALDPASFGIDRNIGTFTFQLNANYLEKLEQDVAVDAPTLDLKGVEGAPEWQATFDLTWAMGAFRVNYGYSWFDQTSRISNVNLTTQPDYFPAEWTYYDERSVHDLRASYEINDELEIYGGVNNFTDQEPEPIGFGDASYPVSSLGRFFYMGLNSTF